MKKRFLSYSYLVFIHFIEISENSTSNRAKQKCNSLVPSIVIVILITIDSIKSVGEVTLRNINHKRLVMLLNNTIIIKSAHFGGILFN